MKKISLAFLLVSLMTVFSACGGGGGGGGGNDGLPSAKSFAYVTNADSNGISAYTIGASGALTQFNCSGAGCNGSYFATGTTPNSVSVHPSGKFAYVVNGGSAEISAYTITPATGALTQIVCSGSSMGCQGSNFWAPPSPTSVAVDPSGKYAYVVSTGYDGVAGYSINATTGALLPVQCLSECTGPGSPLFWAGDSPLAVTVDPSGKFVYVASRDSADIAAFSIDAATGSLTRIACVGDAAICSTVGNNFRINSFSGAYSIAVDPSGKFAYSANNLGDVSAFTINTTTGALTKIVCTSGCNDSMYSVGNFAAGPGSVSVTVHPSGKFVYVANEYYGDITAFTIHPTSGTLTKIDCGGGAGCNGANFTAGTQPSSVTVDPSGNLLYVTNSGSDNVSAYTINTSAGSLTRLDADPNTDGIQNFTAGAGPSSITTVRIQP